MTTAIMTAERIMIVVYSVLTVAAVLNGDWGGAVDAGASLAVWVIVLHLEMERLAVRRGIGDATYDSARRAGKSVLR